MQKVYEFVPYSGFKFVFVSLQIIFVRRSEVVNAMSGQASSGDGSEADRMLSQTNSKTEHYSLADDDPPPTGRDLLLCECCILRSSIVTDAGTR